MRFVVRLERFIDVLMSFATLVGFGSTLWLVWIFLNATPVVSTSTTSLGPQGLSPWNTGTVVIQGVPFFWVFTSLISLSAGHTYRSLKHLLLTIARKNPPHPPQLPHVAPTKIVPRLQQTESP